METADLSVEFGVGLLGEGLAGLALVALLVLLALWRRVTLPSVLVVSRWVRPFEERPGAKAGDEHPYERHPKFRIWVQNQDSAPLIDAQLVLRLPGRGFIHAVRANGGAGEWEPRVVPPGAPDRDPTLLPDEWAVRCPAGMRPHATWRLEVNVSDDTPELEVQVLRERARFGRADGEHQIGPALSGQSLGLLVATGASVTAFLWWFALPESTTLVMVSLMLMGGWALVLYSLVRPVYAGVMSGWAGVGRGWTRLDDGTAKPIGWSAEEEKRLFAEQQRKKGKARRPA